MSPNKHTGNDNPNPSSTTARYLSPNANTTIPKRNGITSRDHSPSNGRHKESGYDHTNNTVFILDPPDHHHPVIFDSPQSIGRVSSVAEDAASESQDREQSRQREWDRDTGRVGRRRKDSAAALTH